MHPLLPYLATSYSNWASCTTVYLSDTQSAHRLDDTAITQESNSAIPTPPQAVLSPSRPTLAHPCAWTCANGSVTSPSFKLVRLQAKLAYLAGGYERERKQSERIEGAWEWEEHLFVAEEEDDLGGDSGSYVSDDTYRSSPPSPIFDSPSAVDIIPTDRDPTHYPRCPQEYSFARVLFAEPETELEETASLSSLEDGMEEDEEFLGYAMEPCSYAELYPGEEDDDSYFAELPTFGDALPPSLPLVSPTSFTYTTVIKTLHHSTSPPAPEPVPSPPPLPSPTPVFAFAADRMLSVPEGFDLDFVVVEDELDEHDWEFEEAEDDSSDDGEPPCFLSPAPNAPPCPSQLAYLSPELDIEDDDDDEDQSEYLSESFVHLPSLRVVPLPPRERGIPDWRDWLRRNAIAQSAQKQQLPCWAPF